MNNATIPKTRCGKIKLLNDLKSGKITIADIAGDSFTIWTNEGDNYTNNKTGEVLSRIQFEAQTLKGTHIVMVPAEGCEPLKDL